MLKIYNAQKNPNKPLGDKFFLQTGATCNDTESGETVTRSLYVNNVAKEKTKQRQTRYQVR